MPAGKITPLEYLCWTRDWSYQHLADEIGKVTGIYRSQDCWRKVAQGKTKPQRRTKVALEEFLAHNKVPQKVAR
jgi:hypothetical protein